MAAVEILESPEFIEDVAPLLRLVTTPQRVGSPFTYGPPVALRRSARERMLRRRHRTLAVLAIVASLTILAVPGHVFGATTGAGLSTDVATSTVLASGMDYVVAPGDTVASIARLMNPSDPSIARTALVSELGSDHVVVGEHVLIP